MVTNTQATCSVNVPEGCRAARLRQPQGLQDCLCLSMLPSHDCTCGRTTLQSKLDRG